MSKIELAHQSVPPGAPSAGNLVVYAKTDNIAYWKDDVGVEHAMGGGGAGISAGTQSVASGTVVFANSNGVTFGMSGSSQITASVAAATQSTGPSGIAAGTQTATSGSIVFSNSNNVTFGMAGSTRVTASASFAQSTQPAINAAAGTQTATSGTVVFSNANNVTFGMVGSTQVTASASYSQSTAPGAVAAGTQTATSGTLIFSNANGMSFGMAGSATITGSYSQSTSPSAIAAGTQTATSGTVVFADSNGYLFGMNGGSITLYETKASYYEFVGANALVAEAFSQNSFMVHRIAVPARIDATQMDVLAAVSNSSSAAGSITIRAGIYTMSGSTASLLSSTSRTWAYNSTLAGSSYTVQSGTRYRSIALGTWAVTPGDYLFGMVVSVATALTSGSYSWYGHRDLTINGADYATTYSRYMNHGVYGTTTNAVPNSIQLSQISQVGGGGDNNFFPWFNLVGTF